MSGRQHLDTDWTRGAKEEYLEGSGVNDKAEMLRNWRMLSIEKLIEDVSTWFLVERFKS